MKRLSLPDVALCAVTSVALPETVRAVERCLEQVAFGSALLLTDLPPPGGWRGQFDWHHIDAINTREEYSEFILRRLVNHVDRSHVLIVQWDGFIIDASRWRPEFLQFDYLGAPWPQFDDGRTVGNGGFSLRSKRLLQLTSAPDFHCEHPEDVSICRTHRSELEERGIRFAPEPVAEKFAFERGRRTESFGFHGLFNFPDVFPPNDLKATLDALDPTLLCGRDGADLILELARRRDLGRVWQLGRLRARHCGLTSELLRFWARLVWTVVHPSGS